MNDLKYFLVVEANMQWQSGIVSAIINDKTKFPCFSYDYLVEEYYENFNMRGKLISNICERELHFQYKSFSQIGSCYGWTISKNEFDKLKRAVELKPLVEEYNRLVNS
jgi:hypothetical protein